jgi:2-amino-4-hydroxy-6-hydroxymethyldihydropteridine diphosphokinase
MNSVYLLLGSNLNDRTASLQRARNDISSRIGSITGKSSIYESESWGFQSEQLFLNQVIRIETDQKPLEVLVEILRIEKEHGRIRSSEKGYASRIIDIDILFFNDEIISEENLTIPHPKIPDRMFTLLPLSELDHSLIHPCSSKTVGELIGECQDPLNVYRYPAEN